MKSLKSRFGKFAVSTEKMAKVKGGITCHSGDGTKSFDSIYVALIYCSNDPSCAGCF